MTDPITTAADDDTPNEILAAAKEAKLHAEAAAKATVEKAKTWPLAKIGLGVGIGSAAIAGAVLFNRSRTQK
ncbi:MULTISPECIES: hypothetical protein [Sphingomonas]|uniref:Uncharacterized protein n=1 Tax=Sphingomonas aerolata TaxID=185951 RepID=A0A2T4YQI0_9SPHN|nr:MULTISPECIES: hypothetical protein [Sphingomonas]MBB3585427.1 hypothetical protein [Sphingomonas sp. BK481]MBP2513159.1 hypothetical protein [Sphingomonas sp. PvP018]MDY0966120.1 hypothetical protein [Sphingomonas sp. CFBP9021]MDY1008691.1 hypothetical protein [Sphingomonas sp. CFBP9019]NII58030.1 hypothetical protein [Sphingomonas aerolata]